MPDNVELHVGFGTGAVGMSVMDALVQRSPRRVRMVNRSGRATTSIGQASARAPKGPLARCVPFGFVG
jgi:hypothetical protein